MNLLYGLRKNAQLRPAGLATQDVHGSRTWAECIDRVYAAANLIRELGGQVGDRFSLLMLNSPAYFELYYAAAACGCIVVPCNTRWTAGEIENALADADCKILFFDDFFASIALGIAARIPSLRLCRVSDTAGDGGEVRYEEGISRMRPEPVYEARPDDVYGLFYTSGTTSGAKGVMLTHANILANAYHVLIDMKITQDWTWLHSAPMFHLADGALSFAISLAGGRHCFIPQFEVAAFLQAVPRYQVTAALLLPTMMNMILAHPAAAEADLSTLRHILYGASPMPFELLRRALDRLDCDIWQAYGLTESGPIITLLRPEEHRAAAQSAASSPLSAGRAVTGVEIAIRKENGDIVTSGGPGEILARGANIMKGYWNSPEATATTLRDGWLHTADVGRIDSDGYLFVLDRMKDMIKSGGENVFTPEVESILYTHPSILEASVVGLPDELWGERVAAFVVPRTGCRINEGEIIRWCRERMANFKCPRTVIVIDVLPKSGAGKIQKRRLLDLAVRHRAESRGTAQ